MPARTYLDWNATAPLRPEARAAMASAGELQGNPSSVHAEGRAARRLIEDARDRVATLLGARPENVIFTSGGTEANMLALSPAIEVDGDRSRRDRLLVSAIEHPSVLAGGRFSRQALEELPVATGGVLDLDALTARLGRGNTASALVSIMLANNETGVVQPVAQAAEIVHSVGGLLHVDAVQAAGKIAVNVTDLGADLLTLSAHKFGGPKGAGALIKGRDGVHLADPLIKGGGQERGSRAGTENVAAIAGMGAAAEAARLNLAADGARIAALRDRLEAGLERAAPDTVVFGAREARLPNTCLFAQPGIKAETALIALDLDGLAVSSGSACSSGKVAPSHVLKAMGVAPELARGAIRVSLGYSTEEADVDRFLEAWIKHVRVLLKERPGIAA
jgi:cysteine desulfurase